MTIALLNNRYQVIQVLGAGGFGETSLAEDTHMPSRRRCVIKQLKPIVNNPYNHKMITQRFEREAATLEVLGRGSDQIPELYAYFSEHGEFYLVQEWIQGQTLIDIVETQGCQTESNVREILLSLLSILIYVHSQGIIHRDIKPDNIILRSRDNKPVLIDFGAVKETVRSVASSPHPGSRSMVIGTPGYMPTEQAIGRPVYASDIYSLGLTAVYLLTGKHPSELATHPQTGEILWVDLAPNVSPHLAQVINQSIQPHVSDRYSTASKMLYALKSARDTAQQSSMTTATVHISPKKILSTHQTQAISSLPTIPTSIWQKPVLIIASLLLGSVIGGVAISSLTREQQPQVSLTTSSPPRPFSESTDINPTSLPNSLPKEPADTASTLQPPVEPVVPVQSQPQVTARFKLTPETPPPPPQQNQDGAPSNSKISRVPAFPTGTSQQTVKAVLGQPSRNSRGLWNTRAFVYRLEDNVDLGYLFDQKTGVLRQTEATFPQSINSEVMQKTLQGMLNGNANSDIKQGLQKVRDRQTQRYSFKVGELKGVIERNQQDRIYIGVWDADLH
ncbi:serine/threonine protein kinase [Anabaenopsis tanganyikae CS-531]|uniref:non-specific serine/threonine protein kinase n=2 Tax=Anabaenopsis TaxID=110103 RepID=A0ABT6KBL5_9CYAN|nr:MULTISPECIES: serine/threonine-protein kinase [Anabaenopsis]MDB9539001.1 serine/threonine-protein kinase [Anabaenopsis arnoldii]MDH6091289.1 serine/threonine protein kinase [Anabaenopsis arnoldii]MDH6105237.1 serine/threonine protein kinase [Anabaenopsis tanganyikae CS-531]